MTELHLDKTDMSKNIESLKKSIFDKKQKSNTINLIAQGIADIKNMMMPIVRAPDHSYKIRPGNGLRFH